MTPSPIAILAACRTPAEVQGIVGTTGDCPVTDWLRDMGLAEVRVSGSGYATWVTDGGCLKRAYLGDGVEGLVKP